MELVSHIANATFSSLIRTKTKQSKCLKNTAFKQKTFQIVKERTMREASRDHSKSHRPKPTWARVIARIVCMTRQVIGRFRRTGGANRDRTGDLLVANQTLSQLSYGPDKRKLSTLVGLGGVAPPTSPLSGVRSN